MANRRLRAIGCSQRRDEAFGRIASIGGWRGGGRMPSRALVVGAVH